MWTHPSEAALVDVLEGTAGARVVSHVAACARCRARVEETRAGLDLAVRAAAPEPSPVYWEAMRRRVAEDAARGAGRESRPLVRRPLWAAAALAGAAVLAVVAVRPGAAPTPMGPASPAAALPAWSPLPPAGDDSSLLAFERAVPDALATAPSVACTGVAECIASLDDDEVQALAEALRDELGEGTTL